MWAKKKKGKSRWCGTSLMKEVKETKKTLAQRESKGKKLQLIYFKHPRVCFSLLLFVQRIHLDIRVGEHDIDAVVVQAKDKVNEVTFTLQHLIEQIEQILKEQDYQRVSLSFQLILSLLVKNSFLSTKPLNQGKNTLPVPWSF